MKYDEFALAIYRNKVDTKISKLHRMAYIAWIRLKIFTGYRLRFALDILGICISVLQYLLLSLLANPQDLARLGYGTDYFAFVVWGVALARYVWDLVGMMVHWVWHEISSGTFGVIVSTTTSIKLWLMGQALFSTIWASIWFMGVMLVANLVGFHPSLSIFQLIQIVFVILVMIIIHAGIGIMFTGISIYHKQVDVLVFLLAGIIEMFGGVIYPLSLLWNIPVLYYVALALPFTHGLEIIRKVAISGYSIITPPLLTHFIVLLSFVWIIPLGFKTVDYYLAKARRTGDVFSY